MKTSGQKENVEESETSLSHTFGNGSGVTTAQPSQSIDTEQPRSGKPHDSEGNSSSLTRRATGPRTIEGKQRSKRNALKHGIFSEIALLKGESHTKYDSLLSGPCEALQPEGKLEEVLVEKLATTFWRQRRLIQAEVAEIRKGIDFMQWDQLTREQEELRKICLSFPENEGGVIHRIENELVFERCLDLLDALRSRLDQNGFTEPDTAILRKLYGDCRQNDLGVNLYGLYLIWRSSAQVSEAERLERGFASPEECKRKVIEAIDDEIRRLKRHQKALAAIDTERMKVEAVRRAVPESPALDRLLRYEASLERSFDRTLSQLERLQRMRAGQPVLPELKVRVSS